MSEPYRDPYQRTPINGTFYKNLHGDDAFAEVERLAKVSQVEPPVAVVDEIPAASQPEPPEPPASSSVPTIDESEGSAADAPVVEPAVS